MTRQGGESVPLLKRCRLLLCLPLLLLPALVWAPHAQALSAAAAGNIGIEQVYVNVPELDVFVRAQDAAGKPLSPKLVRAAGVELRLGDTLLETGNIQTANEPICYTFVIDNSSEVDRDTFLQFRSAVIALQRQCGARDQIALYGMDADGAMQCLLPASSDRTAIVTALRTMPRASAKPLDLTAAASAVYADIEANYQNLAPRKVVVVMTNAISLLGNLPALITMNSGLADDLNMAFTVLAATGDELEEDLFGQAQSAHLVTCEPAAVKQTLLDEVAALSGVIEFKTAIDPALYGERWERLTLSVPSMGSAISAGATVYMGHRLEHPAVVTVTPTGRRELTVTFNQAVTPATARLSTAYLVQSEDVWGFRLGVRSVAVADDGMSAVLTMLSDLYAGSYSVCLRGVAAALSSANTSDAGEKVAFAIEDWPRDRGFYLARLRMPALVAALVLLALAVRAFARTRRERAAEKEAEVAHLLSGAEDIAATPHRWLTLFLRPPGAITENRWAAMVESSLLIGADPAQCELCVPDARMAAQHAVLSLEGDAVLIQPLGKARVYVNDQLLAGPYHLRGDDTVRLGRTQLRVIV